MVSKTDENFTVLTIPKLNVFHREHSLIVTFGKLLLPQMCFPKINILYRKIAIGLFLHSESETIIKRKISIF